MTSQTWGDGFIPRVNDRSRPGVMLALRPDDLFGGRAPSLPHVIVDARLATKDHDLSAGLRESDVSMIVDTQAWRYADARTWKSRWGKFDHVPEYPFIPHRDWVHNYVSRDLAAQVEMGAGCLMLPGWFTSLQNIELATNVALWTIESFEGFRHKGNLTPAISWLPVKIGSRDASLAAAKVYVDSGIVQGIYAQFDRVNGLRDPLDRLKRSAKLLLDIQNVGLPVIAGHFGPVGIIIRAIGIAAADCGPCNGQSFDFSRSINAAVPRPTREASSSGGPPALRMWISELGQTVTASQMAAVRKSRIAFAEIICRRPCHQFRLGRDTVNVAVWHSVLCLCEEARLQSRLPASMRLDAARRSLMAMKSHIGLIDKILAREGEKTLLRDHLDVQIALLDDTVFMHGAA